MGRDPDRYPNRQESAEPIRSSKGNRQSDYCDESEQGDYDQSARETNLLADDREDEVGVGVGNPSPPRAARSEPHPEGSTGTECAQTLQDLVSVSQFIGIWIQESRHPGKPVVGSVGKHQGADRSHDPGHRHVPERRGGNGQDRECRRRNDQDEDRFR